MMELSKTERFDAIINIWNGEFPNYPLTKADLTKPRSMIGAFFQIFNRLGIDIDAVLSPPPENERDEHTIYYWDLLPIINILRTINHILSSLQQATMLPLTISHLLQPDAKTSHSMLLLLFNRMAFNEERLKDIEPYEAELFGRRDKVKSLDERRNQLVEVLNEQAKEKGKRAERLEKLDHDIKNFEEELKLEKESHNEEKQELDALLEENRQVELLLSQKRTHRDTLLAEVARKRALRVYDAEDIMAQAEQAAQNVQEAEEKLNSLKETLMQKENSLKNLQKIKPNLDLANTLLHDVMKLSENLNEVEGGDLESDSKEGELDVLGVELSELTQQRAELAAAARELQQRRADNCARRRQHSEQLERELREAEEADRKNSEKAKRSIQVVEEIKQRTIQYEEEKMRAVAELAQIKKQFTSELGAYEDALLKKLTDAEKKIEKRLDGRRRC